LQGLTEYFGLLKQVFGHDMLYVCQNTLEGLEATPFKDAEFTVMVSNCVI
jgi:hypothetical protein